MAPKKPQQGPTGENAWREIIEQAQLVDEKWQVKVIMIEAAGSDQDRIYLNKFETFAVQERRFVVKNICKTETIFMVNQLGGEKKVKDDNLRVFEEGQAFLKEKKDIPPDILALIIKHLILKMKEEYLFIKRQRLQVREGMRRESSTMVDRAEVRGSVNVKTPESAEPPPPPPKGKGKKPEDDDTLLPEPAEGKKYNTLLRVRGEEWRDKVYVDDYPTDGPHLYVALTGFMVPELAGCLIRIGIPLSALVQVRIDPLTSSVPSTLIRATKRGQSQTEMLTEKSLRFWEDIQLLRINKETCDDFKNTAFIVFSPPYWDTESLSGNPDKIYDEICYLMYDVQDLTRQHLHYLDNMDIINIPDGILEDRYEKYYHALIDDLNLECVTTYSIMDSILQTVCKSQELEEMSSRSSLSTAVTITQPRKSLEDEEKLEKAEGFVKEVFNTLCKTEANRKAYRLTYGEEYEEHKDPVVINYGDFAKYPTFHLGNINLDNIVWGSLFGMPIHKLWADQNRPQGELEARINFHVNVLLSCFGRQDVETAELNRLLHILACRKLYNNRSSLKKKHLPPSGLTEFKKVYLKRSVLAEPLLQPASLGRSFSSTSPSFPSMTRSDNESSESNENDPEIRRIRFLFDCPDISELVSAAEIANGKPINHLIDDFEYFEDFSGVSAFQILLEAFNKFNCVDYKYCTVTDCFVLMFFNSHDKDGISREEWRCHLSTPLCLQDFFDFVLEEQYDWIQNEEIIYDKSVMIKTQSEFVLVNNNLLDSCINETDVQEDLLLEGSLKYQELEAAEEATPEPSDSKFTSSTKKALTPTSTDLESKSTKKPKSPLAMKERQSILPPAYEKPVKPFCGYDLGDRRVEVFGKDATFFSRDGTRILSMYTMIIPMNIEFIIMSVVPGNGYNEFWIHRALGDDVTPDIIDSCESFRVTTKDQVMINIKKKSYKIPLPVVTMSTPENIKRKETTPESKVTIVPEIFESRPFHALFVTWPNGLITETVYEDNSSIISHIKQYYVSPHMELDEEMRCISLNGEVLVFRLSGEIEVLRPDGSYMKITKYGKRVVVPEGTDEQSDVSSDKSKKGKGKVNKLKTSKSSSKSSKNAMDDEVLDKPIEYELIIDEFETIETSGLRQNWINEIPFTIENLLIRTATDYCLGEIFSRRMDGTHILLNKDGVQVVTFPNKTRIITNFIVEDEEIFPEWTEEERQYFDMLDSDSVDTDNTLNKSKGSISQKSGYGYGSSMTSSINKKGEEEEGEEMDRTDGYVSVQIIFTVEHPYFTTVTVDRSTDKISVESPNNTKVVIDANNNYKMTLDNVTTAEFNGQNLNINYEACPECHSFTTCDIKITSDEMSSVTKLQQHWLRMKDSFSKRVVVNEEGGISLVETPYSDEVIINPEETGNLGEETADFAEDKPFDGKSESSMISHGKCREMYLAKTLRFFVLRRELTCSELVHRALLDRYRKDCRWQPWCSINQYDTFGDNRSLLSLLTPVHVTETEKWLMDSKLANKPKYLTYKDLKKDCGKGFYHWMRPYGRFEPKPMTPDNVLPPRLPRAFVLRTLEQQWSSSARESLKGAKELLNAIIKYRRVIESDSETLLHVPIVDLRTEDERRIDDVVQALAHRIYEGLKCRLEEKVQMHAKADITTKPPLPADEMSLEGELEEEPINKQMALEEERRDHVSQMEQAEAMSPSLKRYWRRRAEELKEEQFYQYLLREGSVPPYFRNVLGGAIWWDMNHTADDAVTKAERRQMKCVCADDASNPDGTVFDAPFM